MFISCFRTFLNLLEGLLELCNIKVNIANCFNKLPYIKWEESLQQMVKQLVYFCFY